MSFHDTLIRIKAKDERLQELSKKVNVNKNLLNTIYLEASFKLKIFSPEDIVTIIENKYLGREITLDGYTKIHDSVMNKIIREVVKGYDSK